jgi:hypothetical protein
VRSIKLAAAAAAICLLFSLNPTGAQALELSEKVALQAAMQRHVDRTMIDGTYLDLDLQQGTFSKLYPVTAHTIIMQMGAHYVLCYDFRDEAGKKVEMDLYLARKGKSYVVFHTTLRQRAQLMALMQQGKVERVD